MQVSFFSLRRKGEVLIVLKFIRRGLTAAVFVCGIAASVTFGGLAAARWMGNPLPMAAGWGMAVVASGSMEPFIPTGSLIFIQRQVEYAPGDIITYQQGDELITHRLHQITGSGAIARGDANNTDDAPVALEQIKGAVQWVIPGFGKTLIKIRSQIWMLFAAVGCFILSLWKEKKADTSHKGEAVLNKSSGKAGRWLQTVSALNYGAIGLCVILGVLCFSLTSTAARMFLSGKGTGQGTIAAFAFNAYKANETTANKNASTLILYGENVEQKQLSDIAQSGNQTGQIVGSMTADGLCQAVYPFKVTSHKEKETDKTRTSEVATRYDVILALPQDLPVGKGRIAVKLKKIASKCKDSYPDVLQPAVCDGASPEKEWALPAPFDSRMETRPNPINSNESIVTTINLYRFEQVGEFEPNVLEYDDLALVFEAQADYWKEVVGSLAGPAGAFYDNVELSVRAWQADQGGAA